MTRFGAWTEMAGAAALEAARGATDGWDRLRRAKRIADERRALAALDDRLLNDVGLTRDEAAREAARGIFDLPKRR